MARPPKHKPIPPPCKIDGGLLTRETRRLEAVRLMNAGYTQKEVAEKLGMAQSTIREDLKYALEELILTRLGESEAWSIQYDRLNDNYLLMVKMLEEILKNVNLFLITDSDETFVNNNALDNILAIMDKCQSIIDMQNRMSGNYAVSKVALTDPTGKNQYEPKLTGPERVKGILSILGASGAGSIREQLELRRVKHAGQAVDGKGTTGT